ncbi:sugar transporter ST1 [Besnoitia besnoiti]|uniref:Sugar transporter ST1 n=1 Tax=Besnoitia besnoiti TaxID=94643 RepID=A0A2A9M8M1_BESBE|nr:sugar transporter ST1 [Besnoitia besnoiti]PFH33514.1 sugar transporter ST1 [Besnoitia besnoiti]
MSPAAQPEQASPPVEASASCTRDVTVFPVAAAAAPRASAEAPAAPPRASAAAPAPTKIFPSVSTVSTEIGAPAEAETPAPATDGAARKEKKGSSGRESPLGIRFFLAVVTACMTGLVAGYDLCCVSVVLNPVQHTFHLCGSDFTCADKSLFIALLAPGAAIGGLFGGVLADAIGRRAALASSDFLVVIGGSLISGSDAFSLLLLGRFFLGLASGVGFVVFAAYISEISPQALRGALVSSQEILQVCGCLGAYGAAWAVGAANWRPLLSVIPALGVLQALCLFFFLPESPRWLVQRGWFTEAERALRRLGMDRDCAAACVVSMKQSQEQAPLAAGEFIKTVHRGISVHGRTLALAVACALAHLATGGSTIQYFVVDIFQFAGICDTRAAGFSVGMAKMLGVLTCVCLVDIWGRRKLLFLGVGGSCVCHILLTVSFGTLQLEHGYLSGRCGLEELAAGLGSLEPASYVVFSALLSYIFFWSVGWAGLMLVIASEVVPTCVRGLGVGLTTMTCHVLGFILQISLEPLFAAVTHAGTFAIFIVGSVMSLVFVFALVPEAKGRSLEKIQQSMKAAPERSAGGNAQPEGEKQADGESWQAVDGDCRVSP